MSLAGFLDRTGLGSREARAWASYDWANSAMVTVVMTAVFPVYYSKSLSEGLDPSDAKVYYLWATTAALVASAIASPLLGAVADSRGRRKTFLAVAMLFGVASVAALAFFDTGAWGGALAAFALANIGATLSFVFYDSLLPFVAKGGDMDRLSTAAYGIGYLGGGLALGLCTLLISFPGVVGMEPGTAPVRASFVVVAAWWGIFSIPVLRRVPEPPPTVAAARRGAVRQLLDTLAELRRYPQALLVLLAFLLYNDGIVTIIRMAAIFAEDRDIPSETVLTILLLVQFVALPAAFGYGQLARRFGAKRSVLFGIGGYGVITLLAGWMSTTTHFVALALAVALVQGGVQALSRSLFASFIPASRSAEFFSLFGVAEKFFSILGPMVLSWSIAWVGDRWAVLSLLPFFAVGALLLARVDEEEGRRRATAG
ncbi:MAG: MFS transporter [Planctomycetota bacterium]